MRKSYFNQTHWRTIQNFLPEQYHFNDQYNPVEDYWDWQGHTVHLDRFIHPNASHKIIQLHGVGTNGRMISSIVGGPLWKRGYETVALDLLNYGETHVAAGHDATYDDWIEQVVAFIDYEYERDKKPIILYGLSAGGMLAYHAASINKKVAGIVGMCFMDQRMARTRRETARIGFMGEHGSSTLGWFRNSPIGQFRVPMRLAGKMNTLVNEKNALKACLKDPTSAANRVSINFLDSYMNHQPQVELEDFDTCPILLTQPEEDLWTKIHLSTAVLDRIQKVPTEITLLENAGHYPLEQPGLRQMEDAIDQFIRRLSASRVTYPMNGEV